MAKCKYEENFPERAECYMDEGHTEAELARHLGVSVTTLETYKNEYPEFLAAIKRGKVQTDDNVENALLKRALGYTETVTQEKVLADGRIVEYEKTTHYPPDTTAQIFWLKNRRPEEWRDRKQLEHTGEDGKPIKILEVRYPNVKRN